MPQDNDTIAEDLDSSSEPIPESKERRAVSLRGCSDVLEWQRGRNGR